MSAFTNLLDMLDAGAQFKSVIGAIYGAILSGQATVSSAEEGEYDVIIENMNWDKQEDAWLNTQGITNIERSEGLSCGDHYDVISFRLSRVPIPNLALYRELGTLTRFQE
jgi:hypothetical protein